MTTKNMYKSQFENYLNRLVFKSKGSFGNSNHINLEGDMAYLIRAIMYDVLSPGYSKKSDLEKRRAKEEWEDTFNKGFSRHGILFEDIPQIIFKELLKSNLHKKYDPSRKASIETYVDRMIRFKVLKLKTIANANKAICKDCKSTNVKEIIEFDFEIPICSDCGSDHIDDNKIQIISNNIYSNDSEDDTKNIFDEITKDIVFSHKQEFKFLYRLFEQLKVNKKEKIYLILSEYGFNDTEILKDENEIMNSKLDQLNNFSTKVDQFSLEDLKFSENELKKIKLQLKNKYLNLQAKV